MIDAAEPAPAGRQGAAALRPAGRALSAALPGARARAERHRGRRRAALHGRAHRGGIVDAARRKYTDAAAGGRGARRADLPRRAGRPRAGAARDAMSAPADRPYTLVAELTYRCPLRCAYCSNPVDSRGTARSSTRRRGCACSARPRRWASCSSTSPAASRCCATTSRRWSRRRARSTSTPTSSPAASRCARERLARLRAAGLDAVQLSFQDVTAAGAERIAGLRSFDRKLEVARLGAGARPAAHAQRRAPPRQPRPRRPSSSRSPSGSAPTGSSWPTRSTWAGRCVNRAALLPTREQLERAREVAGGRAAAAARPDGDPVRAARLPRRPPAGLHGRLGPPLPRGRARRASRCPATPRTRIPGSQFEQRARPPAGGDLARLARLPRLPRRGLDARALPELRPPRRSTSAAAAARPSPSPATRPRPTRPARCAPPRPGRGGASGAGQSERS